jgi:hypothetical protein
MRSTDVNRYTGIYKIGFVNVNERKQARDMEM